MGVAGDDEPTRPIHGVGGSDRGRSEELRDAGLLAPIYRGAPMYELTTLGYLYLAGELDAESLPRRRTVR